MPTIALRLGLVIAGSLALGTVACSGGSTTPSTAVAPVIPSEAAETTTAPLVTPSGPFNVATLTALPGGATGSVRTLSGVPGKAGFLNGPPGVALFGEITDVVVAPNGDLFVSDHSNHVIRRIDPAGTVTTYAGTGVAGDDDGPAATARPRPRSSEGLGIAVQKDGSIVVADTGNNVVRVIEGWR